MTTHDLAAFGWTPGLAHAFTALEPMDLSPARVCAQDRGRFVVITSDGEIVAEPSGRLRHIPGSFPAVGDWVGVRLSDGPGMIEAVLPRRGAFTRAVTDPTRRGAVAAAEVVAANVDVLLVVTGGLQDLNPRRLERYLAAAWESGAEPCVVLTKIDLVEDPQTAIDMAAAAAPGAPVLPVSNVTGEGIEAVRGRIGFGRTAALLGSSGVGKSTLVNRLAGAERQATSLVRADGRGRHTTTRRELILLPEGGVVLDTPGMRLFSPVDDAGLDAAFSEIEALARGCRFKDCGHGGEPGCSVQAAVAAGHLEADRLAAYAKLKRELGHLERKDDKPAESERRRRWRGVHRAVKARLREKRSGLD